MPSDPLRQSCLEALQKWPAFADRYWWDDPARPDLGCFGSGYNNWGVQTNQKYVGALAVLAAAPDLDEAAVGMSRELLRERALRALRFSLASHVSGDHHCSDGDKWGHTWISGLGIERMMHGVEALDEHLTDADRAGVRRMMISEANWLLTDLEVTGTKWAADGGNRPESNLWNGAILARAGFMCPDDPRVGDWMEKAHRFLLNGISIEADATDETVIAGRPLREWHVGPNFFPHYALDHHGYLNVGYMVICLSNIAIFHFACKTAGWEAPPDLYHHAGDLWRLVKRLIFADGRLIRIGGDTRQRYCYCQDYLLPTLLWAADWAGDAHAAELEAGQIKLIRIEQDFNGDGSFLSRRLETIARTNPYYYTRLESDKAVALAMNAYWGRTTGIEFPPAGEGLWGTPPQTGDRQPFCTNDAQNGVSPNGPPPSSDTLEEEVAGGWEEPEHGAVFHRSEQRVASWSWRASEPPQGLCLPPASGHLAEWCANMGGGVRLLGESGKRKVIRHEQALFDGGFITTGVMADSTRAVLPEGWTAKEQAAHHYAVAALPDERTVVVMEWCRLGVRTYLAEIKGLKLNVPNDLFNGFSRRYAGAGGEQVVEGTGAGVRALDSRWACVDDTIGAVGIYGAESLFLYQAGVRRAAGHGDSLYYDELCFPCAMGTMALDPGAVVLDCASAVLSGADATETRRVAETGARRLDCDRDDCRAVSVEGADGRGYLLVARFDMEGAQESATVQVQMPGATGAVDISTGRDLSIADGALTIDLRPGDAVVAGP